MMLSLYPKIGTYLLSALLLVACQPPVPVDENPTPKNNEPISKPLTISADSVTMTPDHILNVKPSRYQPSLGLQGSIEPTKQTKFIASRELIIDKVLVLEGQWVNKDTPLLIVRRQTMPSKQTELTNEKNAENVKGILPENLSSDSVSSKVSTPIKKTGPIQQDNQTANSINSASINTSKAPNSKTDNIITNAPKKLPTALAEETRADDDGVKDNLEAINLRSTNTTSSSELITIRASFSGRVTDLQAQAGQQVSARTPLLRLSDDTDLRFIATLPIQAESQLSIGQTVNFTTNSMSDKFTGQISKLAPGEQLNQLLVYVHVISNDTGSGKLVPNMVATGRVDYGQLEVGTIVPKIALHDVDLTVIQTPPYQSLMPLTANIWIIKQDQRLTRQPVEVVSYDPITQQYLIAGVSNDSLICLADLPVASAGKKVIVS